jgi:hypothetical protein
VPRNHSPLFAELRDVHAKEVVFFLGPAPGHLIK